MSKTYPILQVDDVQPVIENATLGLVPLQQSASHSAIEACLEAVADGTPPSVPEWTDTYAENAIAISYVHSKPSHWYGRVSRGKFSSQTKNRLIHELHSRQVRAFWLDQCLAQRKDDGDAGWAVFGLVPYAVLPVLVFGNFNTLNSILQSYVQLERLPEHVLSCVATDLEPLLETASSAASPSSSHIDGGDKETVLDFVEMCRFWPMIERALAHKAKGMFYEKQTIEGLRNWTQTLEFAKRMLNGQHQDFGDDLTSITRENVCIVISDLKDMINYIIMSPSLDENHFEGLGYNVLTALSVVTGALGSGALTNAKLYQPEDRNALLLAGMCFNMFANSPSVRNLRSVEVVKIIEDPYTAFGDICERIPATDQFIANALSGANVLYNRLAFDQVTVPHAGVADEVTIYSDENSQVPTSRRWNGQWELIPHLSLCMRAKLIDIGERSMNSEPYDDFILRQCFTEYDVTGKPVQAALCGAPLTEKHISVPLIAISQFSTTWKLRTMERELLEKHGLRGWTSHVMFLGICDTIRRKVSIEATVVVHMTILEQEDQLLKGRIARSSALKWLKMLITRSSCPLHKRAWILRWISANFDNVDYTWYCGVRINLHHFAWEKWVIRVPPARAEDGILTNSIGSARFVKVSRVSVETLATCPQLPLEDVIHFVQAAILLSQKSIAHEESNRQTENVHQAFIRHVFEIWLGLLTGLYRAYELQNGITEASHLRLLLPGYWARDEMIELTSLKILETGSGFVEGLANTLSTVSELTVENGNHHLHWDLRSSNTFWEVKEIVFNTAHTAGMMLTLMVVCLTTAAREPQAGTSSAGADSEVEEGHSAQGYKNVLEYQIYHAIRKLCKTFASSRETQAVIHTLIEHVIRNTRLPKEAIDWRIPPEGQKAIREAIMSSGSDAYSALVTQVDAVFESLQKVHATMCHVRRAKIKLEPGQSFVDGTESCFKSMLRIPGVDEEGTGQKMMRNHSKGDESGEEEDIRAVIRCRDIDVNPTEEMVRKPKRLVVTLEFSERLCHV